MLGTGIVELTKVYKCPPNGSLEISLFSLQTNTAFLLEESTKLLISASFKSRNSKPIHCSTKPTLIRMKLPSAILLALLAAENAAPTTPEPDTSVEGSNDVEAKAYECRVTLYNGYNWTGRSQVYDYWFSKKQAPVCSA